jgi:hypothetical protein
MVRRVRSSFELEVFDQGPSAMRRLEDFLAIYLQYLTPKHRTDTNQLKHYLQSPLQGRRIIYFGLTFRNQPCGFCAFMYYPASNIGIFDFMVIAPTARGQGAYFAFADLISEYLEIKRIIADYFIAEIVADEGETDTLTNPAAFIRLVRLQGFRRARIIYHAPDPSIVRSLSPCRASLMIASNNDRDAISAAELLRIVDLIYFNHYLLWYGPFMSRNDRVQYDRVLKEERARFAQRAAAHDPVILNGMKGHDVRLEPTSERHRAVILVFLTASAAVGLVAAVSPGITTGWIALGTAALAIVAVLFNMKLRRLFLRLFDQQG